MLNTNTALPSPPGELGCPPTATPLEYWLRPVPPGVTPDPLFSVPPPALFEPECPPDPPWSPPPAFPDLPPSTPPAPAPAPPPSPE